MPGFGRVMRRGERSKKEPEGARAVQGERFSGCESLEEDGEEAARERVGRRFAHSRAVENERVSCIAKREM